MRAGETEDPYIPFSYIPFWKQGRRGRRPRNEEEWNELRKEFYDAIYNRDVYDLRTLLLLGADKFVNTPGEGDIFTTKDLRTSVEFKRHIDVAYLPLLIAYEYKSGHMYTMLREAGASLDLLINQYPSKKEKILKFDAKVMAWLAERKRMYEYRKTRTYGQLATDVFNDMIGRKSNDSDSRHGYQDDGLLLHDEKWEHTVH